MVPGHEMFLSSLGICRFGDCSCHPFPFSSREEYKPLCKECHRNWSSLVPSQIPTGNRTEEHQSSPLCHQETAVPGLCSEQGSFSAVSPSLCCRVMETEMCSSCDGISDEPVETQTVDGSLKPFPFIKEQPDTLWGWKVLKTGVNILEFGIKFWPLSVTHETMW